MNLKKNSFEIILGKEKMLVTSTISILHYVFYYFTDNLQQ